MVVIGDELIISIHALRKECDFTQNKDCDTIVYISIHALRKECDAAHCLVVRPCHNFYPRTP